MATSCSEIEPLLTGYVDRDISESDRALVDEHLSACEPCRRDALAEDVARHVVHARAPHLGERAPLTLQARCARLARRQAGRPAAWSRVRTSGLAVAATLLLALGGLVAFGLVDASGTALAAELALDHLKCFALFERVSEVAEARTLEDTLRATYGWRIRVPESLDAEHLRLVGGRRCFAGDGRVAHILYRHEGRALSLFAVPDSAYAERALTMLGHRARMWTRGGFTYVVVANEPDESLDRVAEYFKRTIQ